MGRSLRLPATIGSLFPFHADLFGGAPKKRTDRLLVRFQGHSNGGQNHGDAYQFTIRKRDEHLLPREKEHLKHRPVAETIMALGTEEEKARFLDWDRSPSNYYVLSVVPYDASGGNRAAARYGAGFMLGAIVSHYNVAVDVLEEGGDLQLKLKDWVKMEDYSIGPNDCGQVIIKTHDDIQKYLGKKKQFKPEYVDSFFRADAVSTGLQPEEFLPFLNAHRMSLHVIGIDGKVLYSHTPESVGLTRNKKCRSVIYLLAHNRHYWELNSHLNSLEQKVDNLEVEVKPPNCYYATPSAEKPLQHFCMHARDVEAIILKTQREEVSDKKKITWHNIHYDGDVEDLFVRFLTHHNYECEIRVSRNNITGVGMKINDHGYNVRSYKKQDEMPLVFGSRDVYEITMKEMTRFQSGLMNEGAKSRYHPAVVTAFGEYRMGGLYKGLVEGSGLCGGFDVVRAYTAMLMSMENLPVLSRFDEFMEISWQVLDDSFYLVERIHGEMSATIS